MADKEQLSYSNVSKWVSSPVFMFDADLAVLGLDTNGAAPQRIYGLRVEGQISDYKGDPAECYWLRAVEDLAEPQNKADYVAYFGDVRRLETVLSGIVHASLHTDYRSSFDKADFSGYHNRAQTDFNEDTSEECQSDLDCNVASRPNGGFVLELHSNRHGKGECVSSVNATLTQEGVEDILRFTEMVRGWSQTNIAEIEKQVREYKASLEVAEPIIPQV